MRKMIFLALAIFMATPLFAEDRESYPQLAPDGTYVGGRPQLAPDGTYVGGRPMLAPNGKYVGDGSND